MWKEIEINLCHYYIKQDISSERVTTSFSDLVNVWEEDVSRNEAVLRFKHSNPNLKAPDQSIIEFISSVVEGKECDLNLESSSSNLSLKMSGTLFPIRKYEFNLSLKTAETFFREITLPLIMLVAELKHRQDMLCQQLEAKDVEIMEYQLEQFKITRKNVITSKFTKEDFLTESMKHVDKRLKSSIGSARNVFLEDFNQFYPAYRNVVLPTSTDLLKQGKLSEEKNEEPLGKIHEEAKLPPKRKYAPEPTVPIKRSKAKKRIL